jgi:LacI family transcriptional regulator
MKKKVILKDIAKHFNVSIASVSKALKNSYDIGETLRKKIQEYAKEKGYKPNIFALSLKNKQTKTIGIILPNILNLYFAKVFSGIEKIANEKGYNVIICISNDSLQKEINATETLLNGTVDGLILSLAEETQKKQSFKHLHSAINQGIPLVMFDRVTDEINCDKVIIDDMQAACNATNFLIKRGRKKIAIISVISDTSVGKFRLNGYLKALEENNISYDKNLILKIKKHDDFDASLKVMLGNRNIDALLCLEESSTINALELLRNQKIKVPQDIAIIGFTNGELPKHVTPTITTVSQHGVYIGETSMNFMNERLEKINNLEEFPSRLKVVKTNIIEREST